ncbi:MAG: long-chain fatty acid--CoA ligase [Streptosporangiales bacterium]|nr:long-chain fatty acid--CoA ligase [Streptosporangiales bacterium]
MSFNLATMLRESTSAVPDRPCLYFAGRTVTYRELDESSSAFARGLRALGLGRDDVLAMSLPNLPEFVVAYFGALKAGVVVMPLNPLLRSGELAYHLTDSGARRLVCYEPLVPVAQGTGIAGLDVYVVPVPGAGTTPQPEGTHAFTELLRRGEPDETERVRGDIEPTSADDTAVLLYTSGTTGRPKGAELSHFQLYMNCTVGSDLFDVRSDDVAFGGLPLFHVYGLSSVLNTGVRTGGAVSLLPRFEGQAALDQIAADGVTVMVGVPTMYAAILAADRAGRDLSRLRIGSSGGAAMPAELLRAFEEAFGVVILEGYGLSETASAASFNRSVDDRRFMSVGRPMWGVEMRVVDEHDRPLSPGRDHVGEIVLRGHNVITRYRNRPDETAETFRNGWFHTGDLGYVDEDGYLFIVDRKKDLVIRGGFNVYPREVEEVLYAHPAVAEAAVIGVPDEWLGEEVAAVVALRPGVTATPDELVAYCEERLAAYKYPRTVRVLDELPKGPSGKILKPELRATCGRTGAK